MTEIQKFRKAVNGFNRHDVVTYIEYINNKHRNEVTQLQNRLQTATRPLANPTLEQDHAELQQKYADLEQENAELSAQLESLKQEAARLQAQITELQNTPAAPAEPSFTEQELEAYRRAERAERLATDRARQIRQQAQGVLADTTARIRESAQLLDEATQNMVDRLNQYKDYVSNSGTVLDEAAAALSALCPEE